MPSTKLRWKIRKKALPWSIRKCCIMYTKVFLKKILPCFTVKKVVCMIHEEKDGKKTQSGPFTLLPRTEVPEDNDMQSRYGMLNEMCRAFVQKKETEFKAQAEEYLKKESLAEHFLPVR